MWDLDIVNFGHTNEPRQTPIKMARSSKRFARWKISIHPLPSSWTLRENLYSHLPSKNTHTHPTVQNPYTYVKQGNFVYQVYTLKKRKFFILDSQKFAKIYIHTCPGKIWWKFTNTPISSNPVHTCKIGKFCLPGRVQNSHSDEKRDFFPISIG
jgi:hypothetical protein